MKTQNAPHGTDCKCDHCWENGLGFIAEHGYIASVMPKAQADARRAELDGSGMLGLLGQFATPTPKQEE